MSSTSAYYIKVLEQLWAEHLVQIDRRDASSITGTVQEIEDEGVSIKTGLEEGEEERIIHIAYGDIRGVSDAGWDYDIIGW